MCSSKTESVEDKSHVYSSEPHFVCDEMRAEAGKVTIQSYVDRKYGLASAFYPHSSYARIIITKLLMFSYVEECNYCANLELRGHL